MADAAKLEVMDPHEYLSALRLDLDEEGLPTAATLADLCRHAVWRWGICGRAALTNFARSRLRAARVEAEAGRARVAEVIDALITLGDIAEVRSLGVKRLARVHPCWIRLSDDVGALWGTVPSSVLGPGFNADSSDDVTRRFDAREVELQVALREHDVQERALEDWIGTPGHVRSLEVRHADVYLPLDRLWEVLTKGLDTDGAPLDSLEGVWAVTGAPGAFFGGPGRDGSAVGRWKKPEAEGVWLAKRRGHNENHFHPLIVRVAEGRTTWARDLYDEEDFRWALLARGLALGQQERVLVVPDERGVELRAAHPLPNQAKRVIRMFGRRTGAWRWRLEPSRLPQLRSALNRLGVAVSE